MANLFSCFIAFAVAFACISLLQPLAIRLGLVDLPHGRKQHEGQIPLIGGIAMFLGLLFALLTLPISLHDYRSLIAGSALLVFVGILDDFHELSTRARFVSQVAAALLMTAWGGITLLNLGNLVFHKEILLHGWALPVTVFATVGIINAVNMTDGVDGLAGGLTLIELILLFFLAFHGGQLLAAHILMLMVAVVVAFLFFNFPVPGRRNARVFMGDAGSMFLGFVLSWFLVELSQGTTRVVSPVIMLWIMTVPLFDVGGVMVRRLQKRASLFAPDREHLHHVLQDWGLSNMQISLLLCGFALLCGLIGILATHLGITDGVMFIAFVILFLIYLAVLNFSRKRT